MPKYLSISTLLTNNPSFAKIINVAIIISGYTNITQQIVGNKEDAIKEVDREEFAEFLDKRFKSAKKASKKEINKTTSHIGNEIEQLKKEDDGGKNFFREIYEKAIKNIF